MLLLFFPFAELLLELQALFAEAEGSEDPVASGNAKCNAKAKTRPNATKTNRDFASSDANIKCRCDAWAAKTIAKLVKLSLFFFSPSTLQQARKGVSLGLPTQHEGGSWRGAGDRVRSHTTSTASEEPQKKKKLRLEPAGCSRFDAAA